MFLCPELWKNNNWELTEPVLSFSHDCIILLSKNKAGCKSVVRLQDIPNKDLEADSDPLRIAASETMLSFPGALTWQSHQTTSIKNNYSSGNVPPPGDVWRLKEIYCSETMGVKHKTGRFRAGVSKTQAVKKICIFFISAGITDVNIYCCLQLFRERLCVWLHLRMLISQSWVWRPEQFTRIANTSTYPRRFTSITANPHRFTSMTCNTSRFH